MGCVASRIDKEERVRVCKERKRLMKQLLRYRKEFADAQQTYLRSLRNTGVTLRQFTESESLEIDETTSGVGFPPSPPPPLPPSPPPPPSFSPDLRKFEDKPPETQSVTEEIIEIHEEGGHTPPPPVASSSWEDYFEGVFGSTSTSLHCGKGGGKVEQDEEENWADTNTEFIDEDEEVFAVVEVDVLPEKLHIGELVDDNLSMTSWHTKDTADMAMVVWKNKKTLTGIIKDLDEYFLKASVIVKEIAVFVDMDAGGTFFYQSFKESKRKSSNSAKVVTALTWTWSSRSLLSTQKMGDISGSVEPCKPGAHRITLQRLYSEEQKLYKDVKELEIAKVEYGRKSSLLQRQEEEHDWTKADKTRSTYESLQTYILNLQESIGRSSSTILALINKELHPQLITLASGLIHMWQIMHNSHQIVTRQNDSATVHALVEKWQQALHKLPDKMVSEAIKGLLSAVQSIILQQQEECSLCNRSEKVGRRLEKEHTWLSDVEMKFAGSEEANSVLTSKHPLAIRRAKVEALKKLVQDEKAKYMNSVKTTRVMILNNLQTSLPKVFQALVVYSSTSVHIFELILSNAAVSESDDVQTTTSGS